DFFINYYTNNTQARQDTKITYLTLEGNYYVRHNPPVGSIKKGILYLHTSTLGGYS
ncbi:hypothetical protein LY78DRAFT_588568, partial [Colletotrichum sublineola]